ncbi:MAG TPA: methyltransferase domain-containing protein [Roseiarcus sp.]|nr:methyltransferase domain-containing protein [Roseiarcus sp.]
MPHQPIDVLTFSDPIPVSSPREASWYHYIDWPDGTVTRGIVDLRRNIDPYLGWTDFAGKTVLEIGPASGFVTKELEARGASVTCIDLPDENAWDAVPRTDLDVQAWTSQRKSGTNRLRSGWWYTQRIFNGDARVAYCGVQGLDLLRGKARFDVVLFAAVLQHMHHPIDALYSASMLTDTIIVSELAFDRSEATKNGAFFAPARGNEIIGTWWQLSSGLIAQVLETTKFDRKSHEISVGRIWNKASLPEADDSFIDRKFFTSVFKKEPA